MNKIAAGILASICLLGSGCSSTVDKVTNNLDRMGHKQNELTGKTERNSMSEGLALGASIGVGAALAVSSGGASVAYSALVGTGLFGFIGLENDKQDESTRTYLQDHGITVEDHFDKVIITLKEDVTFDLQKTDLKEQFKPTLDGIAMVLKELNKKATFEVVGHADYTGPDSLNQRLSDERATVVTEYLLTKGVNPHNITDYYGVGSSQPKDYCVNLSCMRRIDIIIYKNSLLTKID